MNMHVSVSQYNESASQTMQLKHADV